MSVMDEYSGTDSRRRVPEIADDVIARMDNNSQTDADIEILAEALGLEGEPNWRAFLIGLQGLILARLGDEARAIAQLQCAVSSFEHHLVSFDATTSVYCQSNYQLGVLTWERDEWEAAAACFARCLPHMHDVYAEEPVFIGNVFGFLNLCHSMMGRYAESLAYAEAACLARERDCESLESLMIDNGNLDDWRKAKTVYRAILETCSDQEVLDRVRAYGRRHGLHDE